MVLKFEPRHNVCACLEVMARAISGIFGMIEFLNRSRIFTLIVRNRKLYSSHIQHFWDRATIACDRDPIAIVGKFQEREVAITVESIRRVLAFGDAMKIR
jgi:hypothetical protein